MEHKLFQVLDRQRFPQNAHLSGIISDVESRCKQREPRAASGCSGIFAGAGKIFKKYGSRVYSLINKGTGKRKLSQSFQRWLIVLGVIALLATTAFLWMIQTRLSENNAINLLALNLSDVREDIIDASDGNLLRITRSMAQEINASGTVDAAFLGELMAKYDVTEINVIDEHGIIVVTTYPDFQGYDMRGGKQSAEFMVLLQGEKEYVQSYQPVSFAETEVKPGDSIARKQMELSARESGMSYGFL